MDNDEDFWRRMDRWNSARDDKTNPSPEELCSDRPQLVGRLRKAIKRQTAMTWVSRQLIEPCDACLEHAPNTTISTASEFADELRQMPLASKIAVGRMLAWGMTTVAALVVMAFVWSIVGRNSSSDMLADSKQPDPASNLISKPRNIEYSVPPKIFFSNVNQIVLLIPDVVSISYSFDNIRWSEAKNPSRSKVICRGEIDDHRIVNDSNRGKHVLIKYTDATGTVSPAYRIAIPPLSSFEITDPEFPPTRESDEIDKAAILALLRHASSTAPQPSTTSMAFDGKTRITTPVLHTLPVTIEAWVKPDSYKHGECQFVISSDVSGKNGLGLAICGSVLTAEYNGGMLVPLAAVEASQWSHIAAVFTETETRLYLNGKEVAKGIGAAPPNSTLFVVGCQGRLNPVGFYHGEVSWLRISKTERYRASFVPDVHFETDAQTLFLLDPRDVDGSVAKDTSGSNNHGRIDQFGSKPSVSPANTLAPQSNKSEPR